MNEFKSSLERKATMYEMLLAIENDFIENFYNKLTLEDIPEEIVKKSTPSKVDNILLAILQGLDFQAYIEICNANMIKLQIGKEEKKFLNGELSKIIPVRNNVMHPRPLGILDYYVVKGIFDVVDTVLTKLEWNNVNLVRKLIAEKPESLRLPPSNVRKSDSIIENIPTSVDFEDTSFIGRKKEIGELKEKLNKNNVHILSIIGDGGIGKTALAIQLLYELLDDVNSKFELILWTSLKTNELNNYEFKEINNAIRTTSEMYMELGKFVGNENMENIQEYLIDLAKEFNMLLVLDNLETINTNDIKDFLDRFTEYGKVLITSRIGLGEMEHRYKLGGMRDEDVIEYMNILLELYGFEAIMTEEKKKEIAIHQLYANPLAIKWFVRCMYNGDDIESILKNKSELSTFCMSNVFEKLSQLAHSILELLSIANIDISVAELMYYMERGVDDYKDISYAINELAKCNFIDDSMFRLKAKLSVTSFAKEFLTLNHIENKESIESYRQKEIWLQTFLQKQLQALEEKPYALKTFDVSNAETEKVVVAFWLNEAVDLFEKKESMEAFSKLELAKKIAPNYYQCNKIAAYLYGTTSREKAKEEYEIAIQCCKKEEDLEKIYICYAGYLLRCNDYFGSIECLEKANNVAKGKNKYIQLEQAKALACIGKFQEANEILDKLDVSKMTEKESNIFWTRRADVKKRESERYDQRDSEKKLNLIMEAFSFLDSCNKPDRGIYQYMVVLLGVLSYMCYNEDAMKFLCQMLNKYYDRLRRESAFRKFRDNMNERFEQINDLEIKEELKKYLIDYDEKMNDLNKNEGVVYAIRYDKHFAFFKNKENLQGVYFKLTPELMGIQLGSIVEYGEIIDVQKGKMANKIISYR